MSIIGDIAHANDAKQFYTQLQKVLQQTKDYDQLCLEIERLIKKYKDQQKYYKGEW